MTRYRVSLEDKVAVISDLHLEEKQSVIINGNRRIVTSKRKLAKTMLACLAEAFIIILNGDTADLRWKPATDNKREEAGNRSPRNTGPPGLKELEWLVRTLDDMELLERTVFVTGNHDYNIREFPLLSDVITRKYCLIPTGKAFTLVTHGDTGPYASIVEKRTQRLPEGKRCAVPGDLLEYRKRLERYNYPPLPRLKDEWWLVCGHYHNPCRKKESKVAGLPSLEGVLKPNSNLIFAVIDQANGAVDLIRFPKEVYSF